jgi:hypothetical protein
MKTTYIKNYTAWKALFEATEFEEGAEGFESSDTAGGANIIVQLKEKATEAANSDKGAVVATMELKDWISDNTGPLTQAIAEPATLIQVVEAVEPWYDAHHQALADEEVGDKFAEDIISKEQSTGGGSEEIDQVSDEQYYTDEDEDELLF